MKDFSWASCYLGKPWKLGAKGPDSFDCWGLLYYIYEHHYGVNLPEYPVVNTNTVAKVVRLINAGISGPQWQRLQTAEHACAVGMSKNKNSLHHVGIFIDIDMGYVLHCAQGNNVIAQPLTDLERTGWSRIEFYKFEAMK